MYLRHCVHFVNHECVMFGVTSYFPDWPWDDIIIASMNFYGCVDTAESAKSFPALTKALACIILEKWLPKYKCVLSHKRFWCTWKMAYLKGHYVCIKFWVKLSKILQKLSKRWKKLLESRQWEERKPWVVCYVQKQHVFCWRCWEMETTVSEQIVWKCGLCEGIYPPKRRNHYLWTY